MSPHKYSSTEKITQREMPNESIMDDNESETSEDVEAIEMAQFTSHMQGVKMQTKNGDEGDYSH